MATSGPAQEQGAAGGLTAPPCQAWKARPCPTQRQSQECPERAPGAPLALQNRAAFVPYRHLTASHRGGRPSRPTDLSRTPAKHLLPRPRGRWAGGAYGAGLPPCHLDMSPGRLRHPPRSQHTGTENSSGEPRAGKGRPSARDAREDTAKNPTAGGWTTDGGGPHGGQGADCPPLGRAESQRARQQEGPHTRETHAQETGDPGTHSTGSSVPAAAAHPPARAPHPPPRLPQLRSKTVKCVPRSLGVFLLISETREGRRERPQ